MTPRPGDSRQEPSGVHSGPRPSGNARSAASAGEAFAVPVDEPGWKLTIPYGPDDRRLFFGRDREKQQILADIRSGRCVVLYGASGVGKTSLIRAGLIPTLNDLGHVAVYVRLTRNPIKVTLKALREHEWVRSAAVEDELYTSLIQVLLETTAGQDVYIFFDQFEVFFTLLGQRRQEDYSATFLEVLAQVHRRQHFHLVFCLREEFRSRLLPDPEKRPATFGMLSESCETPVRGLSRQGAREVIQRTNQELATSWEPELTKAVIDDLFGRRRVDPSQLQIVCHTVHDNSEVEPVPLATYRDDLGGKESILGGYLDERLFRIGRELAAKEDPGRQASAAAETRHVARRLLLALTTSKKTSRPPQHIDYLFDAVGSDDSGRELAQAILGLLVRFRVVTASGREHPTYELAHDSLAATIASWRGQLATVEERLRELLDEGLEAYRTTGAALLAGDLPYIARHKARLAQMNLGKERWELITLSTLRLEQDGSLWLARALKQLPTESLRRTLRQAGDKSVEPILLRLPKASREDCQILLRSLIEIQSKEAEDVFERRYREQAVAEFTVPYPQSGEAE